MHGGGPMTVTSVYPLALTRPKAPTDPLAAKVYLPQQDTELLVDALRERGVTGASVLDLCTGSGAVAIAAARLGAARVTAVDASADAVTYARAGAERAGVSVDVRLGDLRRHVGRYDVVTCNPPYVPTPDVSDPEYHLNGPSHAWDAGIDGRAVLDPLCARVPDLLVPGGAFVLVHSEFADEEESVRALRAGGLHAEIVDERVIPFGPVMTARARWLEERGLLEPGCRVERIVAIVAVAPGDAATGEAARTPATDHTEQQTS
ncbi:Release factor glutamine methyltransferase [Gordonia paraffinivorans]|uniref:Release factor glutamine methyltransferase n=2 Tax=Gordonia paraffinivorans TaxID=175628 RepID=A0ABD7V8C5_9ACTN|nr:Release factor glutamine methyltransferase [Gordonia paraffinivorans]